MNHLQTDMSKLIVELTADIVSSHVSNNNVSIEEVPTLVSNVHHALSTARSSGSEATPEPAVSVRASVKNDHLVCLECGQTFKTIKRHLSNEHGLTPDEYRERWSLPVDYPIVAPGYSKKRSELAKELGLGRKPGQKRGRKKKST